MEIADRLSRQLYHYNTKYLKSRKLEFTPNHRGKIREEVIRKKRRKETNQPRWEVTISETFALIYKSSTLLP
jgi:hypothetical protein